MSFNLIGDHKVKCYAWVNTFIYLSQGTKVKVAKLHENDKKSQTIEIQWYCKEKWNKAWQMFAWFIALEKKMIIKKNKERIIPLSL